MIKKKLLYILFILVFLFYNFSFVYADTYTDSFVYNALPFSAISSISSFGENYIIFRDLKSGLIYLYIVPDTSVYIDADPLSNNAEYLSTYDRSLQFKTYRLSSDKWEFKFSTNSVGLRSVDHKDNFEFLYNTVPIYKGSNLSSILYNKNPFEFPFVSNYESLSSGNFQDLFVNFGSFDTVQPVGLSIWRINDNYDTLLFKLDGTHSYPIYGSNFLFQTNSNEFFYRISQSFLGITFENDVKYRLVLDNCESFNSSYYYVFNSYNFTVGGLTEIDTNQQNYNNLMNNLDKNSQQIINSNKETQNKLNEQTNAIKENTETNKNIFQKIGDILSYINPFSENFFGRKLVELIIDGIKSLFIPEDDFFSNYFEEIKNWFSDRLRFFMGSI